MPPPDWPVCKTVGILLIDDGCGGARFTVAGMALGQELFKKAS